MKALVHLATGFEEIEAINIVDILRRADIDTQMVSINNEKQVCGAHNIEVSADTFFCNADYENADIIILPGGMPGTKNLAECPELLEKINAHYNKGKWIAAICAAPLVFGRMGLLEGKTATCYPSFEPELKGATLSDDKVVISENVITGKGPGVTIDFALEIIKQLKGEELAKQLAAGLIFE